MCDIDVKEEMDLEDGQDPYSKDVFEQVAVKEELEELQQFCDDEVVVKVKYPLALDVVPKSFTEAKNSLMNTPKSKPIRRRKKKSTLTKTLAKRKYKLKRRVHCEDCGIVFATDNALKNHQKLPPSEDTIKCKECSAIFKRITCLTYHVEEIHPSYARLRMPSLYYGPGRGLDKLKCPDCYKEFTQSYGVRRHLEGASLKINKEPVKCDECDLTFVLSNCLNYHVQLKHYKLVPHVLKPNPKSASDSVVADILCEECGKSFPETRYLYHMNTHRKDGPSMYSCDVCKKSFNSKDLFCLHKDQTPSCIPVKNIYKCSHCSRTFASKDTLTRHAKTHTMGKEKPFRCEMCGLCYTQRHSLKTHTLTHTGEKQFSCNLCGKKFAASSKLESHKLIHPEVRRTMLEKCAEMLGINENNDTFSNS